VAFPLVQTTAETAVSSAGTNHAVTLPSGIVAADMTLLVGAIGSVAASLNALTDWNEILDENQIIGLKILNYIGAGVPTTPTFVSSAATRSAWIGLRISGADKTITPQIGTTGISTSSSPDPPSSAVPSGGPKDFLFVACASMAGEEADDDTWVNNPPTNYLPSPPLQKACGTAGTNLAGLIMVAYRQLNTASTENPGPFLTDLSANWRSQTIIVHPAAAPPPVVASGWGATWR